MRVGGKKIAELPAEDLAKGVNLAAAALAEGPIADQVKSVKAAVEAKNRFHHDRIFRGIHLSQVPDWLSGPEVEAKKKAAIDERMAKLADLDAAVRKALEMKPLRWELVPAK